MHCLISEVTWCPCGIENSPLIRDAKPALESLHKAAVG